MNDMIRPQAQVGVQYIVGSSEWVLILDQLYTG